MGQPADPAALQRAMEDAWISRDQLDFFLQCLQADDYKSTVAGATVRFLTADMVYKVGRVFSTVPDQTDGTLIVDAGTGPTEVVLPKNVSNSLFKKAELEAWLSSPAARSPTIIQQLESAKENLQQVRERTACTTIPKKMSMKGTSKRSETPPSNKGTVGHTERAVLRPLQQHKVETASSDFVIYPHVLMINADGSPWGQVAISEIVSQNDDCDNPNANLLSASASFSPFGGGMPALGSSVFSLRGEESQTAQIVMMLEQDKQGLLGAEKWVRELMNQAIDVWRSGGKPPRDYATRILQLCTSAQKLLQQDPMLLRVKSPCYIFGDIHGNFGDLYYFMQKLTTFGEIAYTGSSFLFLGDYVDRDEFGVECIVYLLACKVLAPNQVWLLRGNHESPEVNGDVRQYGDLSFKHECLTKFPGRSGEQVWEALNRVFQYMPAAAVIDGKVFCAHGGIPRYTGGEDDRLKVLEDPRFPRLATIQVQPQIAQQEDPWIQRCRQMMEDLVWSDPIDRNHMNMLDQYGFGDNPRGYGLKTFGSKAVDTFLDNHGFTHVFRAHQEKSNGLRICDNARVVTIFSTSDYVGHQNGAGVVFLGFGCIRMVIKEAKQTVTKK
eukprot:Sspe_Gene.12032::Locus_4097_Transcript_1_1_Confidence_1.000_Length_2117::g.12032::m.12032